VAELTEPERIGGDEGENKRRGVWPVETCTEGSAEMHDNGTASTGASRFTGVAELTELERIGGDEEENKRRVWSAMIDVETCAEG
jgi:hypothetical protein